MNPNKKLLFVILAVVIVFLAVVLVLWSRPPRDYLGKVETITIGATPFELNALIYIAEEQKLFANNGVRVAFKDYDTWMALRP